METHMSAPVGVASRRLSFDTAAVWALSLTGALAVIAFIPTSSISFVYTKVFILTLGAIVSLAFYILARLSRGNIILPPLLFIGALWLVPLAYVLSTVFSGNPVGLSFAGTQFESDTSGFILLVSVLATLVALVFRRAEQYQTFFKIAAVSYVLVIVAQIICIVTAQIFPNVISGGVNLIGSLLDMGMFVGVGILLSLVTLRLLIPSRTWMIVLYVSMVLGLFLLAIVNSSLIWGLLGLVAFAFFVEAIMRRSARNVMGGSEDEIMDSTSVQNEHSNRMLMPSLVVLVVAVFFFASIVTADETKFSVGQKLGNSLGISSIGISPSWQGTFDVARNTYSSSAVFGSGPGTFGIEWLKSRGSDLDINKGLFWNIDFTSGIGWIPTSFVTTGVVGVIAWALFLFVFLILGLRFLILRAPTDGYLRFVAVTSFVASAYLLVLSVFSVPGPVVLAATFIMVGLFISTSRFAGERTETNIVFARNPRVGFVVVFGLTILLLGAIGSAYLVSERYLADVSYNKAVNALNTGDVPAAYTYADNSAAFVESDRVYRLIATAALADMRRLANDTTTPQEKVKTEFQSALSRGIDAGLTATSLAPNNYQNWVMLGDIYQAVVPLGIQGAYSNAKAAYEHAVTLHPTSPVLPLTLAQLEISNKNYPEAEKYLKQSITLKNNYTQAIFLYSQLQASQGKTKEALETAKAALVLAENDPAVWFQVGLLSSASGDNKTAIVALENATKLNPQYANAFFFLGVAYAIDKNLNMALVALEAAANLSEENAKALESDIAALRDGKNPFPPSRLGALGISQAPVTP